MGSADKAGDLTSRRFMEAATAAWPHMSPVEIWKAWVERHDVWQAILTARLSPEARWVADHRDQRERDLAFVHWLEDPANLDAVRRAAGVMRMGWELDEIDLRRSEPAEGTGSGRGR